MQFVNDDMDDELFRRAAEEYPLNTDGGDWNKVLEKMQNANLPQKKKSRGFLLLLILTPLLLICTTYIKNDFVSRNTGSANNNATINPLPGADKNLEIPGNKRELGKIADSSERLNNEETEMSTVIPQKDISTSPEIKQKQYQKQYNTIKSKTNNEIAIAGNTDKNLRAEMKNMSPGKNSDGKRNPVMDENITSSKTQDNGSITNNSDVAVDNTSTEKQANKAVKEDTANATLITTSVKTQKEKTKQAKFYVGLQAGPDFSMVKSTNPNGAGYSIGLIAGYNISNNFAVETGLLWDRKKYVSEGQYFKTDKLNLPPHLTIVSLSGYCEMFEIPLNLRYNISANAKRTWFASAGLSSYLMKKENYDYHYERYGNYYYGNKEYENTTNDWMSVAHLSVGFQKNIKSIGDLRIEPYVKLPLNGVGIGSMPLSSMGIYLGITRPIR